MIKVSELTGVQLDYWTASAGGRLRMMTGPVSMADRLGDYSPSTKWAHGGPLIEEYGLNLSECDPPAWRAWSNDLDAEYGDTPLQAICRAVVRAAFGDEVEEVAGC